MAALSRRGRLALVAFFVLYAAIVIPLGVRKGDDVTTEITQAHRILDGLTLYNTPQTQGVWWTPFALLLVLPAALLADWSLAFARACWGALGILALAWSVFETGRRWGWRPALGALGVVLFPVHNNFHHLNIETFLLALLVATAGDLADGRPARAGIWAGLATALKLFPGLLLPWFAWRRQWKALGVSVAVAAVVTVLPLLPYGPRGALDALGNWLALTLHGQNFQGGAITGLHMQKLGRLAWAIGGVPLSTIGLHVLAVGLVAATLARRPPFDDAPLEVGSVSLLAVVLAPIAWLHTFTLGYLAWVAVIAAAPAGSRGWRTGLWIAGVYASTALSALPLPAALRFVTFFNDTLGALLALALLLVLRRARIRAFPAPTFASGSPQPA